MKEPIEKFLDVSRSCTSVPTRSRGGPNKAILRYSARELTTPAFTVLQNVPVARDAVLEFFAAVVKESVNAFLLHLDNPMSSFDATNVEEAAQMIAEKLHEVMADRPTVWVSLTFKWCLEVLSQVSQQNVNRKAVTERTTLNELLQLYISCKPSKCIMELIDETVGKLLDSEPENCINTILELSAKYGNFFDWILTYIGTKYPKTMVGRLLDRAHIEFTNHMSELLEKQHSLTLSQALQKLKVFRGRILSLTSILNHLGQHHRAQISETLRETAVEGLQSVDLRKTRMKIPFLLQLCKSSPLLLDIMISALSDLITFENVSKAGKIIGQIPTQFLLEDQTMSTLILNMIVHLPETSLCLVFDKLVEFAFDVDLPKSGEDRDITMGIRKQAKEILDQVACHMQKHVHSQMVLPEKDLPVLREIDTRLFTHMVSLYSKQEDKAKFYFRILCLLAFRHGPQKTSQMLAWMLQTAKNEKELSVFPSFCRILLPFQPDCLRELFSQLKAMLTTVAKAEREVVDHQWVDNLYILVKWQNLPPTFASPTSTGQNQQDLQEPKFLRVTEAMLFSYGEVVVFLLEQADISPEVGLKVLDIIGSLGIPMQQTPAMVMRIARKYVDLFFRMLLWTDGPERLQFYQLLALQMIHLCRGLLLAKELVVRGLLEGLFDHYRFLFVDAKTSNRSEQKEDLDDGFCSLMQKNRVAVELRPAAIVHSGTIGTGPRRKGDLTSALDCSEEVLARRLVVVHFIESLCADPTSKDSSTDLSLPMCRLLATTFVDIICVDAIAAQSVWEPYDVARANIERYLGLSRRIEETPFVWEFLGLISDAYPCLWFCIPIFKSLFLSLLSQCEGNVDKTTKPTQQFITVLDKLLTVLVQGQLLSTPFLYVVEIAKEVTLYEAYVMLLDIWAYFFETTPDLNTVEHHFEYVVQMKSSKVEPIRNDPEPYMESVRVVIQSNISRLGFLFPKIFPIEFPPDENESPDSTDDDDDIIVLS